MTIGDKMRELRKSLGWSQQRLAQEIGGQTTYQQIGCWERDKYSPRYDSLIKLHRICKTHIPTYKDGDLFEL